MCVENQCIGAGNGDCGVDPVVRNEVLAIALVSPASGLETVASVGIHELVFLGIHVKIFELEIVVVACIVRGGRDVVAIIHELARIF